MNGHVWYNASALMCNEIWYMSWCAMWYQIELMCDMIYVWWCAVMCGDVWYDAWIVMCDIIYVWWWVIWCMCGDVLCNVIYNRAIEYMKNDLLLMFVWWCVMKIDVRCDDVCGDLLCNVTYNWCVIWCMCGDVWCHVACSREWNHGEVQF
jgi:hypothetical protein